MNPLQKYLAFVYCAWIVLLLVAGALQKETSARRACVLGSAGFGVFLLNLFVANSAIHTAVRILAVIMLAIAGVISFRSRNTGVG